MMAQIAPLQIGPYEIFEEIGRGGMSIVYRARDTRNARIVALKVLPPEFHHQRHLLNRFVKEGQSTLRLEHPNIVRTFEADIANDTYFMAMELVQGENLSDYLKRHHGPLPFDDVIRILRQVASGLDYAHTQGILHRDIKPSNIMLNHDGRALITDFGVARDLGGDVTLVTMPGHSVGTPAYMSPEQAQGDQHVDSRSDIYSLGVVAYAMLTGTMPFDATSQIALLRKIIDASPTPPESINPQLNPSIARALKNVLSKDPQARYATAELFVQALEVGIAEGATAKRQPKPDETVPDVLAAAAATPSIDAPTVSERQISTPRRMRNPLLVAAARARRRSANASSTAKPIAREYILKSTRVQAGKGRRVMAYLLGGAFLVVVVLVAFWARDRFSRQNPDAVTEVALVATPQSDTSPPPPLPPTPTLEATMESGNASMGGAVVVSDSTVISDHVGQPTDTQAVPDAVDSNPTIEPTRPTKTPVVRVLPAPAARAISSAPPTNTPANALPASTPASPPTGTATPTSQPTPSPELEATADATLTPSSAVALVDVTPTSTVSPTSASMDTPEPTPTPNDSVVPPTNTALPLPSVTPTTKPTAIPPPSATPLPVNTPAGEAPLPGATKTNEVDGAVYIFVPAGKFSMGSTRADDEKPLHAVEINAFWMMQTEVTNAQYALCITAGVCTPPLNERIDDPGYADHPVTNIDWGQARDYAEWAGGRLPTEAEWEGAARGTDQRPFPWGGNAPDESLLNFDSIVNDTTPVADYPFGVSPYGIYDMAGNVEEWVGDWYASDYYAASPAQNPVGPADGIFRVVRGGSYHSDANLVLTTTRGKASPNRGYASVGFRVVLDN